MLLITVVVGVAPAGVQVQAQCIQGLPCQGDVQVCAVKPVMAVQRDMRPDSNRQFQAQVLP